MLGAADEGFTLNVNLLGEAILGEDEAQAPPRRACAPCSPRPDVDYVSVKISALCARLDVLAFDQSVTASPSACAPLFNAPPRQ